MADMATDVEDSEVKGAGKKRFIPIAIVVLGIGIWLGYRYYEQTRPYEWGGTVEAKTMTVGSRVGGRVKDVLVREGDTLTEGQPILVLEPGDLEARKIGAQGELEQTRAALEKLEKGARPEELDAAKARALTARAAYAETRAGARKEQIGAARARLSQAQAQADKAEADAKRARDLFSTHAISQAELDTASANARALSAQRDAAKAGLDELENGARAEDVLQARARASEAEASMKLVAAGSRVEDIRAARGLVEAAEGRLKQVLVAIDELTVRAPRPARVEALDLRPGDILAPNTPAATLLEEGQLYVRVYVPETQLGFIKLGASVPIYVDSFPKRGFQGIVEHVNAVGEYTPRNLQTVDERADHVFATRVGIREGGDVLRAGMTAFVRVPR